jgi:hypothetical protein
MAQTRDGQIQNRNATENEGMKKQAENETMRESNLTLMPIDPYIRLLLNGLTPDEFSDNRKSICKCLIKRERLISIANT